MIIKKKLTERDKMEYLTHGGRTKLDRRKFLGQSSTIAGVALFFPSILTLLDQRLYAEELNCPSMGLNDLSNSMAGVFEFHAGGGGVFSEDFIAFDQNGDLFSSYEPWGIPPDDNPGANPSLIDTTFGAALHINSALLRGLKSKIRPEIFPYVTIISGPSISNSDSTSNTYSPIQMFPALGRTGVLAALAGDTANRDSGGRHELVLGTKNPQYSPVVVRNATDAIAVAGVGQVVQDLGGGSQGTARARRIREAIFGLSETQRNQFLSSNLTTQIQTLVRCGFLNAVEVPDLVSSSSLDPNNDPIITGNFTNDGSNGEIPSVFKLIADGFVGAGVVSDNGYDTHDGSAGTSFAKRENGARQLGEVANAAFDKNKTMVVNLLSDGGMGRVLNDGIPVYETMGNGITRIRRPGDNDRNAQAAMMIIHPGKSRSEVLIDSNRCHIGTWNPNGQADEDSSITVGNTSMLGLAFAANWAALHGLENEVARFNNGRMPFEYGKEILVKKIL